MFRLTLLIIYLIPAIYVFFRLKNLIENVNLKRIFSILYFLLVIGFPLFQFFSRYVSTTRYYFLEIAYFYLMPFLLYLFLSVLALDIFRGVNRIFKMIPKEVMRGKSFRKYALLGIFLVSIGIIGAGIVHMNTIRISNYTISVPRKGARIERLKIAMAADFHLGYLVPNGFIERFENIINRIQPDILLLPGDIVEGYRNDGKMEAFASMFRKLKIHYGIYACPGNHDTFRHNDSDEFFRRAGIRILNDEITVIDESFSLVGRKDYHSSDRKELNDLFRNISSDLPVIVLDHRPFALNEISKYRVDIQLSGHTHNGQLFPINYLIHYIYELGWGYKKIRNTHFFVTSGIRLWGPPVRTAGNSEIMEIDVRFK